MKNNKKSLTIALFALVAVVVLGVGYAAITAINLTISGNATATPDQENFTVKFDNTGTTSYTETPISTGTAVPYNNVAIIDTDLTAHFNTQNLTAEGDKATVIYTVKNTSPDLKADITVSVSNSNSTYFSVTKEFGNSSDSITLNPGAVTTLKLEVTVLKTPITADQTSTVVATLNAQPNNS